MVEIPFMVFALFNGISLIMGIIGISMGIKRIAGAPFITIFSGFLFFSNMLITDTLIMDYKPSYTRNTTETGGTSTCTKSGSSVICSFTDSKVTYSYTNSSNKIVSNPDYIPVKFKINNFDVWVYSIVLGSLFIFIGISIQWSKWTL